MNDIRAKIEPFEVGGIGMAFTLIRRRVFEALELPYFVLGKWGNSTGPAEDLRFCEKAREAGFRVSRADPTVRIGHLFTGAVSLGPTGVEFDAAGYRLPT